jgi:hypothetical protein
MMKESPKPTESPENMDGRLATRTILYKYSNFPIPIMAALRLYFSGISAAPAAVFK